MTTIVRQRDRGDCAIACLSMLAGVSYEVAAKAAAKVEQTYGGTAGLHNREVLLAAEALGVALLPTRDPDLEMDEGVLRVRWQKNAGQHRGGHFVALSDGLILCPREGVARPWRQYLSIHHAKACTLLRRAS